MRNCYEIVKTRVQHKNIQGFLRLFSRTFREHFHDNISTVTFCNANNMAFMSNPRPSSVPMFAKIQKNVPPILKCVVRNFSVPVD